MTWTAAGKKVSKCCGPIRDQYPLVSLVKISSAALRLWRTVSHDDGPRRCRWAVRPGSIALESSDSTALARLDICLNLIMDCVCLLAGSDVTSVCLFTLVGRVQV